MASEQAFVFSFILLPTQYLLRQENGSMKNKIGFTKIWSSVVGALQKKKSGEFTAFAEEIRKVPGGVGTLKNPLSPPELLRVS